MRPTATTDLRPIASDRPPTRGERTMPSAEVQLAVTPSHDVIIAESPLHSASSRWSRQPELRENACAAQQTHESQDRDTGPATGAAAARRTEADTRGSASVSAARTASHSTQLILCCIAARRSWALRVLNDTSAPCFGSDVGIVSSRGRPFSTTTNALALKSELGCAQLSSSK